MNRRERLEVDFMIEACEAMAGVRLAAAAAWADPTDAARQRAHDAALALLAVVEDWRTVGESELWHRFPAFLGDEADRGFARAALSYARHARDAEAGAPMTRDEVALAVAVGALPPSCQALLN